MQFVKTWHILHLLLTLLTGFWVVIWVWRTISNNQKNQEMLFKMQMEKNNK